MRPRVGSRSFVLAAHTFTHFCVDYSCVFCLLRFFEPAAGSPSEAAAAGLLLYNLLAFGLQPFAGLFADRRPKFPAAVCGCCLAAGGFALCVSARSSVPWAALVLWSLGNACFHAGGGKDTLHLAEGRMLPCGVFVSSGALGVAFAALSAGSAFPGLPLLLTAGCIPLQAAARRAARSGYCGTARKPFFPGESRIPFHAGAAAAASAVILLRAFGGSLAAGPAGNSAARILAAGVGACLGKILGGASADRFGSRRAAALSLCLSIPAVLFSGDSALLLGAGICLFNMTMPVTLCLLDDVFGGAGGFSFGLSALCLLLGSLPVWFVPFGQAASSALFALSAGGSALLLLLFLPGIQVPLQRAGRRGR